MKMTRLLSLLILCVSAFAGTYTLVPGTGGNILGCVYLTSGRPAIGVPVTWYVAPVGLRSGSHFHDTGSGRPNLVLGVGATGNKTNALGCASVSVVVPPYAGTYNVKMFASGMSDSVTLIAGVAGMYPLAAVLSGLPITLYYDVNHGGRDFYGQSRVNDRIVSLGRWWQGSGYSTMYGNLLIYRYGLDVAGYLDNLPGQAFWDLSPTEKHPSGYEFDIRNPSLSNPVVRHALDVSIQLLCGMYSTSPMPGSGTTKDNAQFWHVACVN